MSQTFASHISVPYGWLKFPAKHLTLSARLEVLTAVLLNIPVFSDVTVCHWSSSPSVSKTRRLDSDNKGTTVLQNTVTSLMFPSYLGRLEYSVKTFIGCSPQQTPDKPSTQLTHTLKHSYACCKEGHSVTIHAVSEGLILSVTFQRKSMGCCKKFPRHKAVGL